ncbi:Phospholipid-transporting ATPase 2 [Camellia lanceoleosa]|uniref:Phospholipid-transporting ATPase 2 n=1 Tax=Camellia lanceoleosa TaxID=1840588 RepID=A0ACC0H5T2_9ERIC|nr:Phospholipid-transporting ATPase 2 [Camellia lanceoleosa]
MLIEFGQQSTLLCCVHWICNRFSWRQKGHQLNQSDNKTFSNPKIIANEVVIGKSGIGEEEQRDEKKIERAYKKLALDALVIQQGRLAEQKTVNKDELLQMEKATAELDAKMKKFAEDAIKFKMDDTVNKDELLQMVRFGAEMVFSSKDSTITDEDIDLIIAKGEEATVELDAKMKKFAEDAIKFKMDDTADLYDFDDEKVALIVFLSHIGSFVPADVATVGLTDRFDFYIPGLLDEEDLVRAASCLNMVFFNKNANILEINFNRAILQYDVLDTLEFTSDRKRMSVVVKDCKSGKINLLSKGADEAILPYARAEEDEYREWSSLFKEANSTLVDRERRVAEVCQRLEHDFEILGIASIEDRLQDGVPETIESLRKAGINFWMLTGDKQNTAIQIALSCNFVSPEPKGQLLLINGKTEDEVSRSLERVLLTMRITNSEAKDVAFVIGGWALEIALKDYKKAFTELAILSRTAICCRVTPSQKAQLVELLKSCDYRTLAIGVGRNDVRMIQQADIGVGISGREGLQAARAVDYSIGSVRLDYDILGLHVWAIVVFVITIHAYAFEKSEMEEISMVALSGCIWLQAFVVALETNPFTILQHLAIWGNLVGFYIINWIVSGVPSSGMYTIMFRLRDVAILLENYACIFLQVVTLWHRPPEILLGSSVYFAPVDV